MNTKAQISDIDLTPDVDLTESRLDILPYKGIMDCNSPHVGGVLNNIYKKKIDYKTAEFVQQYGQVIPLGWYNNKTYVLHKNSDSSSSKAVIECVETGTQWYVEKYVWERNKINKATTRVYLTDSDTSNKPYLKFNEFDASGYIWVHNSLGGHTVKSDLPNMTSVSFAVDSSNKVIATYGASTFGAESAIEQWVINGYSATSTTEPDNIYNFYGDSLAASSYSNSDWKGFIGGTWSIESKTSYGDYPVNSIQVGADFSMAEYFTDGTFNHRGECNYYPSKGIGLAIYDKIPFALFYARTILTYDVQTVLWSSPNHCVYIDNENNVWEVWKEDCTSRVENLISKIENGKVYFKGTGNNVFDMKEEQLYSLNYAYFDDFFFKPLTGWQNVTTGNKVLTNVATGVGDQFNIESNISMAPIFPMKSVYLLPDVIKYDEGIGLGTVGHLSFGGTLNIYYSSTSEGGCDYQWSLRNGAVTFFKNLLLDGVQFSLSDGNTVLSIPLWSDIDDIGNNTIKVEVDGEYYICLKNDKQENLFAYYLMTMNYSENLFLVQTGKYTVLNGFIYQCSFDNNVFTLGDIVCECDGLKFLGAFPLMAFFWSELDKSIYVFTGDNNLRKFKEAYMIEEIKEIFCDSARQLLIVNTDIGCIFLYGEEIFKLSYENNYIYPIYRDGESYVIGDTAVSFSKNDTETEPEVIYCKTEFYGEGHMLKSVNDCVFVRVIKSPSLTAGSLKIKAYALTETTSESSEQTFTFSDSDFDMNGQLLIQYQPQYQAGVGFNVELESTHPIAYMGISHQPEAIQQSPKGKQNVIASPVSKPGKNFRFE